MYITWTQLDMQVNQLLKQYLYVWGAWSIYSENQKIANSVITFSWFIFFIFKNFITMKITSGTKLSRFGSPVFFLFSFFS